LVWDNLNTHASRAMAELVAARSWLTVPPDARLDSRADKEPPPRRCGATTPPKDLENPA